MAEQDVAKRLLILGGTDEGRAIAVAAQARGFDVIYSLAGRTQSPTLPNRPGIVMRRGGFGGATALAAFMMQQGIGCLIDATHPYAVNISANACQAAAQTGVRLLCFDRPAWHAGKGDNWLPVTTVAAAKALADELAADKRDCRVLVTTGRQDASSFADSAACHWLIRVVEARDDLPPLKNGRYIFARGPFHLDGELALLREERIDLLISKNSGGTATRAKLDAAATLGLPVVMVTRPTLPSGPVAHDLTAVERWLDEA